jgi:imidazolonepropionase-like amidohydrolase
LRITKTTGSLKAIRSDVGNAQPSFVGEAQSAAVPIDRSAAQEAFSGVRNARATVMAGFTTVRDVGTFRAFVDVALRDAIDDGTVVGPRMAVAGAYVTVPAAAARSPASPRTSPSRPTSASASPPPPARSGNGRGRSCTAAPTSSR